MNAMQQQVAEFHRKFSVPVESTPKIRRAHLRAKLIREEMEEAAEAIEAGDLVLAIDGLCDSIYVLFGAALEFGVDLEPFFDEVHRSNMEKVGGPTREDGKILKPQGWEPPKIKEILDQC